MPRGERQAENNWWEDEEPADLPPLIQTTPGATGTSPNHPPMTAPIYSQPTWRERETENPEERWWEQPEPPPPPPFTIPSSIYDPSPSTTTASPGMNPLWNGGSPPATSLPVGTDGKATHGWVWTGVAGSWGGKEYDPNGTWEIRQGTGLGYGQYNVGYTPPGPSPSPSPSPRPSPGPSPGPSPRSSVAGGTPQSGLPGVPPSYASAPARVSAQSPIGGAVPTFADAQAAARAYLPAMPAVPAPTSYTASTVAAPTPIPAPAITAPPAFTPPDFASAAERNKVVQAILAAPDVMDQNFQDALFEQQKEQQLQLADQARARLSQATTARGLSAVGGQELFDQAGIEENFIGNLVAARRDVALRAADANRASRLAAVEMANAVQQGDFARAQAAYQTQLQANQSYQQLQAQSQQFYDQINLQAQQEYQRQQQQAQQFYDQINLQAQQEYQRQLMQRAEQERATQALAYQQLLAQREMQRSEQGQSFDQYLRQLQMDEMIRQFNEQMAYNYGRFGWEQQQDIANRFQG